eukprot:CAMPEP_0183344508 /NCGR_PEP_ID=MMETSP0164_2-20130417/10172_1 /TAXON_ID=221442 /ORGANISM="Coccolithus pelagicus ssp braarudi, Strain PLY182g" /LENGTH=45 /DNA_ID= /DNA_START= /DNA_END= /DNA_ORIENTATION=
MINEMSCTVFAPESYASDKHVTSSRRPSGSRLTNVVNKWCLGLKA